MPSTETVTQPFPAVIASVGRRGLALGWILARYNPGRRIHHDPVGIFLLRIDGLCQRGFDLPSLRLGFFARFSEHLAGRPDGKLEIYRVLDSSPDQYWSVDPLEGNINVTGDLHHLRDRCLVRHRKWPGPAGESILTGRR